MGLKVGLPILDAGAADHQLDANRMQNEVYAAQEPAARPHRHGRGGGLGAGAGLAAAPAGGPAGRGEVRAQVQAEEDGGAVRHCEEPGPARRLDRMPANAQAALVARAERRPACRPAAAQRNGRLGDETHDDSRKSFLAEFRLAVLPSRPPSCLSLRAAPRSLRRPDHGAAGVTAGAGSGLRDHRPGGSREGRFPGGRAPGRGHRQARHAEPGRRAGERRRGARGAEGRRLGRERRDRSSSSTTASSSFP